MRQALHGALRRRANDPRGSALGFVAASLPGVFFAAGLGNATTLFLPMMLIGFSNGISLPSAISGAISVHPEIAGAAAGLSGAAQIGTGALLSAVSVRLLAEALRRRRCSC